MKIQENHSKTWFKILTNMGKPIDGSSEKWSLPYRQYKGEELDFSQQQASFSNKDEWTKLEDTKGTWLVSNPKEVYQSNSNHKIFVAELLSTPSHEIKGVIWVNKVRLVREATYLELKRFDIYRVFMPIIVDGR
jgi:hypothetical protein